MKHAGHTHGPRTFTFVTHDTLMALSASCAHRFTLRPTMSTSGRSALIFRTKIFVCLPIHHPGHAPCHGVVSVVQAR